MRVKFNDLVGCVKIERTVELEKINIHDVCVGDYIYIPSILDMSVVTHCNEGYDAESFTSGITDDDYSDNLVEYLKGWKNVWEDVEFYRGNIL